MGDRGSRAKGWLRKTRRLSYWVGLGVLYPANMVLSRTRQAVRHPNSVLHISRMVHLHIPFETTRLLQRLGMKADYLAIGSSPGWMDWNRCDFQKRPLHRLFRQSALEALQEFRLLWGVVAKYEIVHLHFMIGLSESGWELPILKKMGRKIVIHYRGCEVRDRGVNMALHPLVNICQQCDYDGACQTDPFRKRRAVAKRYGDHFLVTTPDLKDFVPEAEYFPFFAAEVGESPLPPRTIAVGRPLRIVHATNHPGLEGTDSIRAVIERLRGKGHAIDFVFLKGVPRSRVLQEYANADLAIGKMKMGYYANTQIESMCLGVPTITHVRPEFMNEQLARSGFILASLADLEATLEYYLTHPEALEQKRRIARQSVLGLHNNEQLARRLIQVYETVKGQPRGPQRDEMRRGRQCQDGFGLPSETGGTALTTHRPEIALCGRRC
jgi:glycosyltransferase involved in cell wall biosynthesis